MSIDCFRDEFCNFTKWVSVKIIIHTNQIIGNIIKSEIEMIIMVH
jgi:hypothetical protein